MLTQKVFTGKRKKIEGKKELKKNIRCCFQGYLLFVSVIVFRLWLIGDVTYIIRSS